MKDLRLPALRRFACAISLLTVLGHTALGFEQSWAQVFVALGAAYGTELSLEAIDAWSARRAPRFAGGLGPLVDFLVPAHISGLAVAMLLYANERCLPFAFAAAVAIASKAVLRARTPRGERHFLNPSNAGITATLLLFPWVGIAPPYHFTEMVAGAWDWIVPAVVVCTGSFLNTRFTGRIPLIAAWMTGFAAQACVRSVVFSTPLAAGLLPMTGMAFLLFSFYMISDPGTTPRRPLAQVTFGAAVAAAYAVLQVFHVVFGLFFALTFVCLVRGIVLHARRTADAPQLPPARPPARAERQPEVAVS